MSKNINHLKQIIMENKEQNPYVHPIQENTLSGYGGMTLRDYFANSSMQSICENAGRNGFHFDKIEEIVVKSYELADAMLKQRLS